MPSPSAPTHITHIPTFSATLLGELHSIFLLILKGCISLLCTLYFCAPGYRAASWRVTVWQPWPAEQDRKKTLPVQKARGYGCCYGFAITANRSKTISWYSSSLVALFCFSLPKAVPTGEKLVVPKSGLILVPHSSRHCNVCQVNGYGHSRKIKSQNWILNILFCHSVLTRTGKLLVRMPHRKQEYI